jgi:arylsulfatase A-like enzyme
MCHPVEFACWWDGSNCRHLLHRFATLAVAWAAGLFVFGSHFAALSAETTSRPNIILILADDMGFSDLGCYGGQIETPRLDALAAGGLRFTQFYNTARCWPTRGSIMTGYYAQQIRRDALPASERGPAGARGPAGQGGSQGVRPVWAPLVTEYLRPLGYRTYHSGKWHIDGQPLKNGFDRSYVLNDHNRYFFPQNHTEDDQPLPPVDPARPQYVTTLIADHAIRCLADHAANHAAKPFFHYLCFTSPHFPLHALQEDIDRYRGRFKEGYDVLRERRWRRLKELGVVSCELSPRTSGLKPWDELTPEEREHFEIRMAIHAAMVDRMDREIGRVLDQLKAMQALENTAIFFLSDNGASAESLVRGDGNDPSAPPGSAQTFLCLETAGANVANTPLRLSKMFVHEGGIATSLVVHWPQGIAARGELRHSPGHVIDLPPTVLELAGGKWPAKWKGEPVPPPQGKSLVPALAKDIVIERDSLWWLHQGNRAIRVGDWKLVAVKDGPWELYDLAKDRGESHDLATQQPGKVRELADRWESLTAQFAKDAGDDVQESPPTAKKKKAKAKQ